MSQNTDKKDKILIKPNPNSPKQGKIILDPTDAAGFMEYFSRLNPGDECKGKWKATLDEAGQRTVTLSITEFEIETEEDEKSGEAPAGIDDPARDEDDNNGVTSAAVEMIKNQDGVPENANNLPPDNTPTH